MLLSEITWSRHNKNSERSQVLYRGEEVYLLLRLEQPLLDPSVLYVLYKDGSEAERSSAVPEDLLKDLLPRKMTPLEYKCWQLEQKR